MLFAYPQQITPSAQPEYVAAVLIDLIMHQPLAQTARGADFLTTLAIDKRLWLTLLAWRRQRDPNWHLPAMATANLPARKAAHLRLVHSS